MDIEEWENKYKPIKNHLDDNASLDGIMFETFGKELEFVLSKDPSYVWTYIVNDVSNMIIANGIHLCDRLGYIITETPWCQPGTAEGNTVSIIASESIEIDEDISCEACKHAQDMEACHCLGEYPSF